jgi:hypothetical protein
MSESTGTVLACINLIDSYTPKANICIGPGIKENQYWQLAWDTNGAVGIEWYQRNHAKEFVQREAVRDLHSDCAG